MKSLKPSEPSDFKVVGHNSYYVIACEKNESDRGKRQRHRSVRLQSGDSHSDDHTWVVDYCLTCHGVDVDKGVGRSVSGSPTRFLPSIFVAS
jgi:hypothetical protein